MASKRTKTGKSTVKAARSATIGALPRTVTKSFQYKVDEDRILNVKITIGTNTPIVRGPKEPKKASRAAKGG